MIGPGRGGRWSDQRMHNLPHRFSTLIIILVLISAACSTKPRNRVPTAAFTITPAAGTTDTLYTFDATPSSDPDEEGEYLQVRWDWDGDGIWDTLWGAGKQKTHRFEDPGSYAIGLQVRDSWGKTGFCVQDLFIGENMYYPGALLAVTPTFGTLDTVFSFDASGSEASIGESDTRRFRWDWEGDGNWDVDWSAEPMRIHQYDTNAVFRAAVEIRNIQGITDTAYADVTVFGGADMPVASFTVTPSAGTVVTEFQFDASGCSDAQDPTSALEVRWDWEGDGDWDTDWTTTKTATYRYLEPGDHTVRLVVRDTHQYLAVTERTVPVTNSPPIASLTVDPETGHVGTLFTLDASCSTDAEEPTSDLLVRWDWEGDGIWDTEPNQSKLVQRYFGIDDTYHIVVEVTDCAGASDTTAVDLVVTNTPPVADLNVSAASGTIATEFVFDASGSYDLETPDSLRFRWDWEGDGEWDSSWNTEGVVTRTFPLVGEYLTTLEVVDPTGASDTTGVTITINNTSPQAGLWVYPAEATLGTTFQVNASQSTDLEDDQTLLSFRWDYESDGTWDTEWGNDPMIEYAYPSIGSYRVTVEVCDTGGLSAQASYMVEVMPEVIWTYGVHSWEASPALSPGEDVVYAGDGGELFALGLDGSLLWMFQTSSDICLTPAVGADGTVYVTARNDGLYAIDATGLKKWRRSIPGLKRSSPVLAPSGAIYVAAADSNLSAVSSDGDLLWSCRLSSSVECSTPAVSADGTAYVVSEDDVLHAVRADGSIQWSVSLGSDSQSSPAIGGSGRIYVGSHNGLHAFDPAGDRLWFVGMSKVDWACPVVGPTEVIYVTGTEGVGAIGPGGDLLWEYRFWDSHSDCHSGATIGSDGVLYVNRDQYVHAITTDGKRSWICRAGWDRIVGSPVLTSSGLLLQAGHGAGLYAIQTTSPGLAIAPWPKFKANNQNTGHR